MHRGHVLFTVIPCSDSVRGNRAGMSRDARCRHTCPVQWHVIAEYGMDCRANLIGGMGLLIAALAGCADQTSRSPGSEEFATADDSPRWRNIAVDAMPISIDSSLFTTAPFTQHHPSSGDFEGYGLAHFRDGNDRSIRIVYIINDEPLPMTDEDLMNANDYQAVALRVPPEDTSDVRILDRGTIDIWGGEMQYEFATERAYSGPTLPPSSTQSGSPAARARASQAAMSRPATAIMESPS